MCRDSAPRQDDGQPEHPSRVSDPREFGQSQVTLCNERPVGAGAQVAAVPHDSSCLTELPEIRADLAGLCMPAAARAPRRMPISAPEAAVVRWPETGSLVSAA